MIVTFIRRLTLGALIASAVVSGVAVAEGTPPGFEGKPLPIYPAKPTDCYLLLKNQFPYVQGGDYPVCRAVLENLNKFCDQPPQYDIRKIHPSTDELAQPAWQSMDAKDDPELIKQIILANSLPKWRESHWQGTSARVEQRVASGDLQLFRADISSSLGDGRQTAYRIENAGEPGKAGFNQARLMIAHVGQRVPAPAFQLSGKLHGELWSFRKSWFLLNFDPSEKRFHIAQLVQIQGRDGQVVAPPRCTFQHIEDHQGVR